MKWIKRILFSLVLLLVLLLIAVGTAIYMYRSTPKWYHPRHLSPQEIKDANNRATQKFNGIISWAAAVQAQNTREQKGTAAAEKPIGPITVSVSEEELNSFAENWPSPDQSLQQLVSKFLTDSRLVLLDDQIVLAGDSKDFGTLSSAQFEPRIDEKGQLWMKLANISAGRLTIPQSMISSKIDKIREKLQQEISTYHGSADIDPTGVANGSAAGVEASRIFLNALADQPSDPVVFIPFDLSNWRHSLPVRISSLKIVEGSITVTFSPMTASEQAALLNKISHADQQQAAVEP